jgi:hypothetical protein
LLHLHGLQPIRIVNTATRLEQTSTSRHKRSDMHRHCHQPTPGSNDNSAAGSFVSDLEKTTLPSGCCVMGLSAVPFHPALLARGLPYFFLKKEKRK